MHNIELSVSSVRFSTPVWASRMEFSHRFTDIAIRLVIVISSESEYVGLDSDIDSHMHDLYHSFMRLILGLWLRMLK